MVRVDLEKIWVDRGKVDLVRVDLVRVDLERWPRRKALTVEDTAVSSAVLHPHFKTLLVKCHCCQNGDNGAREHPSDKDDGTAPSLVPRPPPQLSSLVIRTASDDSCGGGLGTRLDSTRILGFLLLLPSHSLPSDQCLHQFPEKTDKFHNFSAPSQHPMAHENDLSEDILPTAYHLSFHLTLFQRMSRLWSDIKVGEFRANYLTNATKFRWMAIQLLGETLLHLLILLTRMMAEMNILMFKKSPEEILLGPRLAPPLI